MGGGAQPPASLGAGAPREGRGIAHGGGHARGGPAGASARDGRRRAADDRPPARRRVAPRCGDDRADGSHRADRVVARTGAGGDDRQQRRGAQPPARERRGGRAGAHDAPQQGPRVPRRLLPRPLGAVAHAEGEGAGDVPRRGREADDRRRPRRPAVERAPAATHRRAARRGPAARVRRAHARQAPGGRVVGGFVGQPRLGAVAAAVRARRRGQREAVGSRRADRHGGPRALPRAGGRRPGARERGCGGPRAARLLARRRDRDLTPVGIVVRPHARLVVAAYVVQRHHRRDLRAARGERAGGAPCRRRVRAASPAGRRRWARRAACGAVAARGDVGRDRGGDARAPRLRGGGLRLSRPLRRALRGDRRGAGAPPSRARRHRRRRQRVSPPRSRHRSAHSPAVSPCATSPEPTASTSSTSNCRWSAATTRAVRH